MIDSIYSNNIEKLKNLIDEFSAGKGYEVQKLEGGFVIDIPIKYEGGGEENNKEERRQFVYLTANRISSEGEMLYQVFTVCAPEDEYFYKSALMLNMNLPVGAVAISEVEGKNYFVLVDTHRMKDVTADQLELSVLSLAKAGDRMEKILIGEDIS